MSSGIKGNVLPLGDSQIFTSTEQYLGQGERSELFSSRPLGKREASTDNTEERAVKIIKKQLDFGPSRADKPVEKPFPVLGDFSLFNNKKVTIFSEFGEEKAPFLTNPNIPFFSPTRLSRLSFKSIFIANPDPSKEDLEWIGKVEESLKLATSCDTEESLRNALALERVENQGINTSYLCKILTDEVDETGKRKIVIGGVLKFGDEEVGTERNSSRDILRSKVGISPGKSLFRECIASGLHPDRIPCTIKVTFTTIKGTERVASLQKYIPNAREIHTLNVPEASLHIPIEEVFEMAFVDLRLVNTDRNRGNALLPKDSYSMLYLIDHGCVLSEGFKDRAIFCWGSWSQTEFGFSDVYKQKIAELNIENDRMICKNAFPEISDGVLKCLGLSTFLLQESVLLDLSLKQIASFYFSPYPSLEMPSFAANLYEKICEKVSSIEEFDSLAKESVKLGPKWVKEYTSLSENTKSLESFLYRKIADLTL